MRPVLAIACASVLLYDVRAGSLSRWVAAAVGWALCLGLKRAGVHKFEVRVGHSDAGITSLRRRINRVFALELIALLILLAILLPVAPLAAGGASLYVVMIWFRISRRREFYIHSESDAAAVACWNLSDPFNQTWLPFLLAVHCALRYPWLAVIPLFQVAAFRSSFWRAIADLREFGEQLRVWWIWKGQLHLEGDSEARIEWCGRGITRVRIPQASESPWQIRIVRTYRVRGCQAYALQFEARADRARQVTTGVWQDHAPWMSVGLCQEIDLTERWRPVQIAFHATEDQDAAYGGLWLGGEAGMVEIRSWSIVPTQAAQPKTAFVSRPSGRQGAAYPIYAAASYWNLTGVHVFLEHLLRGMIEQGRDARLILTENGTDLVQLPNDLLPLPHDIVAEELPVARNASWPAHWVTLIRLLSERSPCIFLPNVDYRHSCVSPKLPAGVCVVGIIQSDDPVHYEHVGRLGRYWDAIVCVSAACAAKVAELDASLKPRLHVIPNAVCVPEQAPARVLSPSDPLRPLRVVYHGGMNSYQKRILDLAAVLFECERRGIPIRMTVAGDGSEREEFLRLCAPHIESGALRYVGLLPHDRVEALLREHDVYVLPSAFEGMPHAMLEGMAQGCVPVVTDIESAVPELICNGVNGYRVPVGDIGGFADCFGLLQSDGALRMRLGIEAHRTLLGSPYDVRAMVSSYSRVFEQVIEASREGKFRRPAGQILPPPREVAGVSIFPMEHTGWAVDAADQWLAGRRERAAVRAERVLRHFIRS